MSAMSHDNATCSCDFCGLPIPGGAAADGAPQFCCYGCRFVASIKSANHDESRTTSGMQRLGLAVFFAMNVMVFTLLLWSQSEGAADQLADLWYELARYACLIFTIPVVLLLGGPLLTDAVAELRRGRPSLSMLLCLGVAASLAYSVYSLFWDGGHVYFEVACTILLATTLGRWLEATGKLRTTEALRGLSQLLPETVCLCDESGDRQVLAGALRAGDRFRVLPGERVAADGQIVQFSAAVSEHAITGESLPVVKQVGDLIQSGTLVIDGPLIIRASAPSGEGMLARMIAEVIQATAGRTRFERLAERISVGFLPLVVVIAAGTFAVHAWRGNALAGLLAALAVMVIACPCALGLATSMALWAAVGRAATAGVMIRDSDAIGVLARASMICFDKTGTLTSGQAHVAEFLVDHGTESERALQLAEALAANSTHPLAMAVANFARDRIDRESNHLAVSEIRAVPGCGMIGTFDDLGTAVLLGSQAWMAASGCANSLSRDALGNGDEALTETLLGWDNRVRGCFHLREQVRAETEFTVAQLKQAGLRCVMLTGDRQARGESLARQLGIECRAELLPAEKLELIRWMRAEGPVIMVGDGINDAPALAAADVGIALGSGTDISRHTAGVCLIADDLSRLPWLVRLSQATVRTIRWNLVWAFLYNTVGIGLAAAGWLHPIFAAIAMSASGFMVVANSLRLTHFPSETPSQSGRRVEPASPAPRSLLALESSTANSA